MNTKIKLLLCLCLLSQTYLHAQSGLFIDTSYTAEQMVMDFFDSPNVTVSNVTYNGHENGLAYFEADSTDLDIPAGILLSTGNVFSAIGPNEVSGGTETVSGSISDGDLQAIVSNVSIFDAAVLEFDISSSIDNLLFNYVFSSEEYPEYVCSGFNDVFGFFVSGAGYNGPFTNNAENIALVPGTQDFVAINQVNSGEVGNAGEITSCGSLDNSQYYHDNTNGIHLEADGFTVPLPAPFVLLPGETYHVKLVIGDAADGVFDSGVFIGIESLNGDSLLTPIAEIQAETNGNTFSFENESRYATSYQWDFGDGSTSTERYPSPHTYAEDGNYEVLLIIQNYCCSDTTTFLAQVGDVSSTNEIIKDFQLLKNPVKDYIELKLNTATEGKVALYNTTGQLLISRKINANSLIDIQSFQSGIYYLYINLGGKIYLEKVVKI